MDGNDHFSKMGFGPYPITIVPFYRHVLSDNTVIAMKFWLPWTASNAENANINYLECENDSDFYYSTANGGEKFPVIFEFLPYSFSDWTAARDYSRHSWFCSHGYVCVRADCRGSGDSGGLYFDEYERDSEQKDCAEIIRWLAERPWSNAKIGMYGKSWGGFNGLHAAYNRCENLKAVISLYSTDDRFSQDIHYRGGCLRGDGMISWASQMLLWNARPPTPRFCSKNDGNSFESRWKFRLENSTFNWASSVWMRHQKSEDAYWNNGSINRDFSRIDCPILVIGGLNDDYVNSAFRMAANLNENCKTIIGPWPHDWPDVATPGPRVDFLNLCLRWLNCHLKNDEEEKERVKLWAPLQIYIRENLTPIIFEAVTPGRWCSFFKWPECYHYFDGKKNLPDSSSEEILRKSTVTFYLTSSNSLSSESPAAQKNEEKNIFLPPPHVYQGLFSNHCLSFTAPVLPCDQTISNFYSACWRTNPLDTSLIFCGFSKVILSAKMQIDCPDRFSLALRLCHEFPDGRSVLITSGIQNFHFSKAKNSEVILEILLDATTYTIPVGHRLLLAVSPTYFPAMFPLSASAKLKFLASGSTLTIQTLPEKVLFSGGVEENFGPPKPLLQLPKEMLEIVKPFSRDFVVDLSTRDRICVRKFENEGRAKFMISKENWLEMEETNEELYETNTAVDFCLTKNKRYLRRYFHGENIEAKIWVEVEMKADEEDFYVDNKIVVHLNGEEFFEKTWRDIVERICV